jgi:probable HAF family extracellular repeat protein
MSLMDLATTTAVSRTAVVTLTVAAVCGVSAAFGAQTAAPTRACHTTQYKVVELPFLPEVISPSGVVAGIDDAHRAVAWHPKTGTQPLPVPEGFHYTDAAGFTRSGAIVINATDARVKRHAAFIYSNKTLLPLPGRQDIVHGISPAGRIVGEWVPEGAVSSDAVYWDNQQPHSLGFCCGASLKAANALGALVGDAYDAQRHYHAFVWKAGQGQRTIGPADGYSAAIAINDAGHVLVQMGREAYLDHANSLQRLELSPRLYNAVYGINNCDFVVGGYGTDSDHYRAFLWTPAAGFQDLNALTPANSGWRLESALAINNGGEIVGRGDHQRDDTGFLLVPLR